MKNLLLVFGSLFAAIMIAVWVFLDFQKRPSSDANYTKPTTNVSPLVSTQSSPSVSTLNSPSSPNVPPRAEKAKEQLMQEVWNTENRKPLDLYGKVIDQYGQPVMGAEVQGNVLLNVDFTHSRDEIYHTQTDSQGLFNFKDIHGVALGIWPKKEGYTYDLKLPSRRPENYTLDPENPVVFIMWKLKGVEPMLHTHLDSRVPYDGHSAFFGLLTGKKDDRGDLRITLMRNPLQVRRGMDHFNWNVQIEIVGGGLSEVKDPYPNLAPESNYQASFQFSVQAGSSNWTQRLTKMFYVHLRKGEYGRIMLDLTTDSERPDTGISIESWINPSGSRNLEYDSKKEISASRIEEVGLNKAIEELKAK
jgi:hypothetical protein